MLIFHVTVSLSLRPGLHTVAHVEPHDNDAQRDSREFDVEMGLYDKELMFPHLSGRQASLRPGIL